MLERPSFPRLGAGTRHHRPLGQTGEGSDWLLAFTGISGIAGMMIPYVPWGLIRAMQRGSIELTSPRGVWIFNCAILPSRLHRTVERKGNMKPDQDLFGKVCGSGGLGKAISNILAARGANVTIFARRPGPLADAQNEIGGNCVDANRQEIDAVAVDMADASAVSDAFRSQPRIADFLYCCAGGNHAENGFFIDLQATQLDSCMKNNYYSTAYAAKAMLDIWVEDDKKYPGTDVSTSDTTGPKPRRIVFANSAAAFLGLPGSVAYTPAKSAVRALADTLRLEVLRHNSARTTYTIHIAFPADFISPGFVLEQDTKPDLTKRIQGTNVATFAQLEEKFPSSEKVAQGIVARVDRGDFIICEDSLAASLLFTNMVGLSPKRGLGIVDSLWSVVMGWFVVPVLRRRWEKMCREDAINRLR
ncbi:hypothetical protein KXW29_000587 [Aspergillus fumigatus]|nr:hypothetical protein KXX14_000537 [Aspergillus fumigatus]KAH2082631.1 hypothetical protein KXX03_003644 [Aspergillus fumigatus]KAH2290860.1 hypothetical protein KXW02_003092 [Aspergillus fumigatus]KAH2721718.1 hypothetical protein KXW29_000587 [Aspergillus fumigatus]KAH3524866.1 hypothetical protein KXV55_002001 [Aspergillus fumigatus]